MLRLWPEANAQKIRDIGSRTGEHPDAGDLALLDGYLAGLIFYFFYFFFIFFFRGAAGCGVDNCRGRRRSVQLRVMDETGIGKSC